MFQSHFICFDLCFTYFHIWKHRCFYGSWLQLFASPKSSLDLLVETLQALGAAHSSSPRYRRRSFPLVAPKFVAQHPCSLCCQWLVLIEHDSPPVLTVGVAVHRQPQWLLIATGSSAISRPRSHRTRLWCTTGAQSYRTAISWQEQSIAIATWFVFMIVRDRFIECYICCICLGLFGHKMLVEYCAVSFLCAILFLPQRILDSPTKLSLDAALQVFASHVSYNSATRNLACGSQWMCRYYTQVKCLGRCRASCCIRASTNTQLIIQGLGE